MILHEAPEANAARAECETLLRRALDLIDKHDLKPSIAARLAHLIDDISGEHTGGPASHQE